MANTVVGDIIAAAKARIAVVLSTYSALDYEYAVEENNFNNRPKRYGFIPKEVNFIDGRRLRHITGDQTFELILSTDFTNHDDDSAKVVAANELYSEIHEVIKDFATSRLGLTNDVQLIFPLAIAEPEFIEDNTICVLRASIRISYIYTI